MRPYRFTLGSLLVVGGLVASLLGGALPATADDAPAVTSTASDDTWEPADDCDWLPTTDADWAEWNTCMGQATAYGQRKEQVITLGEIGTQMVGQTVAVAASASSGLPVVLEARGSCTLDGSRALAKTAGDCYIWATQPGNEQWYEAEPQVAAFSYVPTASVVTAQVQAKPDKDGKTFVGRGAKVRLDVQVTGSFGTIPAPTGKVVLSIDGVDKPAVDLDASGKAKFDFVAQSTAGLQRLIVRFAGDGAYLPADSKTLSLQVGRAISAGGAMLEVSMDPAPEYILDGELVTVTAEVYPVATNGVVTFSWPRHATESVKTVGKSQVTFTTDDLYPGDYDVTVKYAGTSEGKDGRPVSDAEDVPVYVTADDDGMKVAVATTVVGQNVSVQAESGETVTVQQSLSRAKANAPEARFYVKRPMAARVTVPGATAGEKALVRVQTPEGYRTAGYSTVEGNGTVLLPTMTAEGKGSFLVRVVPDRQDPLYLRVRVSDPPKDAPKANVFKSTALSFLGEVSKDLIKAIPGVNKASSTVGWVVAKLLGLAADPPPDKLDDVKKQLSAEISQTNERVAALSTDIGRLESTVLASGCANLTAFTNEPLARIKQFNEKYKGLQAAANDAMTNARPGASTTNDGSAVFEDWAKAVLDPANGAAQSATSINFSLMGVQAAQTSNPTAPVVGGLSLPDGALAACAKTLQDKWAKDAAAGKYPELGESTYYESLYAYLDLMQSYQVLALNLVTEASHYKALRAWQGLVSANPTTTPKPHLGIDEIDDICDMNLAGYTDTINLSAYCGEVPRFASALYDSLGKQLIAAGRGYSMNPEAGYVPGLGGVVSTRPGNPNLLWVTDINAYGDRAACAGPASSVSKPCGPTVGTTEALTAAAASGLGYTGWRFAGATEWRDLLNVSRASGSTVYDLMKRLGFFPRGGARTGDKLIIYTGDKISVLDPAVKNLWIKPDMKDGLFYPQDSYLFSDGSAALCLFDTAMTVPEGGGPVLPYCEGGTAQLKQPDRAVQLAALPTLFNNLQFSNNYTYDYGKVKGYWLEANAASKSWSNPDFYKGALLYRVKSWQYGRQAGQYVIMNSGKPGWIATTQRLGGPATDEFRWPVRDLSGAVCTPVTVGSGENARTFAPTTLNVAGVRSMCGSDFAAWFTAAMGTPPPPVK